MKNLVRTFKLWIRLNILKTILLSIKKKAGCVRIYPDVHIHVASTSSIFGTGILRLGPKWSGLRYLASEFHLAKNAKLIVNGRFALYTGFHLSVSEGATLVLGEGT